MPRAYSCPLTRPLPCLAPPAPLQVTHSATQEQLEVIATLQPMFAEHILPLITPVDELWQPTDFLPDSSADSDQFYQEVSVLGVRLVGLLDGLWRCGWAGRGSPALHAPSLLPVSHPTTHPPASLPPTLPPLPACPP
jgi:hypothetical protein